MSKPTTDRGLRLAVGVYVVLFALKLAVFLLTGVMALLAEALHTLTDIFVSGFLLAASVWSRKAADEGHMFGHGRAENVAALVAATLFISFTSLKLYEEAVPRLLSPHEATHQNLWLALAVLAFSMVVAAAPLVELIRERQQGAAAKAQLTELVNDELGLLVALLGTLFVVRGHPVADPIAALVVATIIAVNAVSLFRENVSYLLGRSPGPEFLATADHLARSVEGVLGVHDMRAEYVGPDMVHVEMHIQVSRALPFEEAHRIAAEVHRRVVGSAGHGGYCFVHADPVDADLRMSGGA